MKTFILWTMALSVLGLISCNGSGENKPAADSAAVMSKDSAGNMTAEEHSNVSVISPTYTQVDPKAATAVKGIVDDYLKLKNALAADNGNGAADAGKAMYSDLGNVDASLFTAEQKKTYDSMADDLKEHAGHIDKNGGNIDHQREHFAMMSEDVYSLVRAFGGGQPLYHDHCPMYKDKGAMWVSEVAAIKNPYLGGKMPTCGEVKEKIK